MLMTDKWFNEFFYGKRNKKSGRMLENKEEADHALNSYFEFNGFESMSLVKNLGSTFIYLLIYFHGLISLLLLIACKSYANSSNMLNWLKTWLKKHLIWNSSIRFVLQQFQPLMISAMINLYDLRFNNSSNIICSVLSLLIIFWLHLTILFI